MHRGFTMVEILVACVVAMLVSVPLFDLFRSGLRDTRASIREVEGANLAAEVAEQIETLPFDVIKSRIGAEGYTYSSGDGTLADQAIVAPGGQRQFHLSPLPKDFSRSLYLISLPKGVILAEITATWTTGARHRSIKMRRYLVRDTLLPNP